MGQKAVEPVSGGGGGVGYSNIINCDDEEDCIAGSGSGDGPGNVLSPAPGNEARGADGRTGEIWYPGPEGTDSKFCFPFRPGTKSYFPHFLTRHTSLK